MSTQVLLDHAQARPHAARSDKERSEDSTCSKGLQESTSKTFQSKGNRTMKTSKSRTGCGFCKQKRLKCDETKPECKNCLNRERKCPGYKQVYQWKAKCQTDVRTFDVARRRKAVMPRSNVSRQQSKGKTSDVDHHEVHAREAIAKDRTANAIATHNEETNRNSMYSESLGGIESCQNWVDVDLDGFNVDEMIERSQFNNLPAIDRLQSADFTFSAHHEPISTHNYSSWDTTQAHMDGLHIQTETNLVDPTERPNHDVSLTTGVCHNASNRRRDIRGLLRTFYTTSPSVPHPLVHHATTLVEHYFSTICGIYSCFDSFLNPFRYTVSQSWNHSASTYYAIQSMAAAHLGNSLPHMRKKGLDLHRKASQHLGQELQKCRSERLHDDQALLNLLLLGMSASWQRSGDLGLPYLRTARSLICTTLAREGGADSVNTMRPLLRFFEEAMVYWEMVTSFVADESEIDVVQPYPRVEVTPISSEISEDSGSVALPPLVHSSELLPHPWTGVSPESQMLLGQVGRLVRRARVRDKLLEDETHLFEMALELEESLLASSTPPTSSMSDCGDLVTENTDFVTLAETTRDAGLLELYRVFPELLRRRLGPNQMEFDDTDSNESPGVPPQQASQSWLTSFALHILRRLETIPDASNVRCHQLLLIVIAAAELRLQSPGNTDHLEFSDLDLEVFWGRQFARARLHQLAVQLPAQPVYTILELIGEVWRRADASSLQQSDDTFWIDVMVEKGWHTIMG